jgi:hypothetical protein
MLLRGTPGNFNHRRLRLIRIESIMARKVFKPGVPVAKAMHELTRLKSGQACGRVSRLLNPSKGTVRETIVPVHIHGALAAQPVGSPVPFTNVDFLSGSRQQ